MNETVGLKAAMRSLKRRVSYNRPLVLDEFLFNRGLTKQESCIEPVRGSQQDVGRSFDVHDTLPCLAWLAVRDGLHYECHLGSSVERFDAGFFEGGWTGEFEAPSDLIGKVERFGSGVLFDKAEPAILPQTNPREPLFLLRDRVSGRDYISNSYNFVFAAAEISEDDPFLTAATRDLTANSYAAARAGVHANDPLIVSTDRFALYRIAHNAFRIARDGAVKFIQPFLGHSFRNFEAYRTHLDKMTRLAFANVESDARSQKYPPVLTVSGGYDSTAVAALAKPIGVKDAMTLDVSVYGHDDSGAEVSESLGLNLQKIQHISGASIDNLHMAAQDGIGQRAYEFIATSGIGDDVNFASFEQQLPGRTLLTGTGGDFVWSMNSTAGLGHRTNVVYTRSLGEFRLRVGFIHLSPTLFGSLSPASIIRLSNSAELRPWSVGGSYDRPIARRIAEEAGVPRLAFGQAKAATAPHFTDASELWRTATLATMERYRL